MQRLQVKNEKERERHKKAWLFSFRVLFEINVLTCEIQSVAQRLSEEQ